MSKLRVAVVTGFAAAALGIIPAGTAAAHVHGITPLECTPAPTNAGGNEAVTGGHVAEESGLIGIRVIPEVKSEKDLTGGNVPPVLQCP